MFPTEPRTAVCGRTALALLLMASLALAACATPRAPTAGGLPEPGERVPGGLIALQERADEAYLEGRLLDAEQLYRQLLREMPQSAYAWLRLGNVQVRNSELDAAARSYRECLKFAREDARCWNNLALVYVKMATLTLEQSGEFISDREQAARLESFRRRVVESTANALTEAP